MRLTVISRGVHLERVLRVAHAAVVFGDFAFSVLRMNRLKNIDVV